MLCFFTSLKGWLPNVVGDLYYWQAIAYGGMFLGLAFIALETSRWEDDSLPGQDQLLTLSESPDGSPASDTSVSLVLSSNTISTLAFLASVVLTFAVTVPLSILTYRFIEAPGIALGKSLGARWQAKSGTSRSTSRVWIYRISTLSGRTFLNRGRFAQQSPSGAV